MGESIRPSKRVLRLVGLLPASEPEHIEVRGREVGPQPELISRVFGEPYVLHGKTIIPVSRVRFFVPERPSSQESRATAKGKRRSKRLWKQTGLYGVSEPFALIEVSQDGVKIQRIPNVLPIALLGILSGAWNLYWILRTVRERRRD